MEALIPPEFLEEGWFDAVDEALEGDSHPVLWMRHEHATATYDLEELSDVEIDEEAGISYQYSDIIPLQKYQEGWDCAGEWACLIALASSC